jgi:calcineurin-like phosphoesterase family protein
MSARELSAGQTWFTADLHFGHQNIIGYCNRPFDGVSSMNDALIRNWNETVGENDIVYVLGDFALGTIADTLPLAAELSGRKILVAGNHDRCWAGHGHTADGWLERYLDAGFDEVLQGVVRLNLGEQQVLMCHFPYAGDSDDADRFVEHRPTDHGEWLLHGHVHDRWAQLDLMINVGVEVAGYRPIEAEFVLDLIRAGPRHSQIQPLV